MTLPLPCIRFRWHLLLPLLLAFPALAISQPIGSHLFLPTSATDSMAEARLAVHSVGSEAPLADRTNDGEKPTTDQSVINVPNIVRLNGINSTDRDNTPLVSADDSVLFFNSTRLGTRPWARRNPIAKRYDDDIYASYRLPDQDGMERWSDPINVKDLNSGNDDGILAVNPDGQALYFMSFKAGWDTSGGPFYRARLSGEHWVDVHGLGGGINAFFRSEEKGARFFIYGGSISSDGRDFYFATTVHSLNGKHRIWVSHFDGAAWGAPQDLGAEVNHGGGSYAPCIAADGKTLYFTASGREGGYGGDDIYISVLKDGAWQTPFNAGTPINSSGDDAFISITASGEKAYLSRTINGDEDIYVAPIPIKSRPSNVIIVSGQVTDRATGKPIEATIVIEDLSTGKKIFDANSNSITGSYTTVLRPGNDYGISISAPGYVFHSARYKVEQDISYNKLTQDFQIQKLAQGEKFVANNIFFDYNTSLLKQESGPELDRIVMMMKEHPLLRLQINGHTDNVGSADFNKQLSLRRAEAVQEYLVKSGGIDASRITTQGFGYTKPIAPNSTEDGRKQNRRSEFTILQL